MEWLLAALAVVAIALAAVASTGRGGGMPDLVDDRLVPDLPKGELTSADLEQVSFAVVPRGYRMDQVDQLLERLAGQLRSDPDDGNPDAIAVVVARHSMPDEPEALPAQPGETPLPQLPT